MSDMLDDLLVIDRSSLATAAAAQTAVAVAAQGALDLSKVDLSDVALAQFGNWREKVKDTQTNVSTMVLDLSNQTKVNEAKSLRQRLFNQPRADARTVSKALKSKLAQVSKAVGAEETLVIAAYDEAEKPLTEQIDAAQAKLDAEKEAARRAEEERLAGMRSTVDEIMARWLHRARAEGMTAERISAGIAALQALAMPDEVADVAAHWTTSKAATVSAMERLKLDAERREETARLEAQRAENERIAAEQAERQRQLDEQAAALARQEQEIEAARQRANTPAEVAASEGKADNPEPGKLEAAPITAAHELPTESALDELEAPLHGEQQCSSAGSDRGVDRRESQAGSPVEARQPDIHEQAPQQVLQAEAATPDATDRGEPVIASPVGGPMGAGQPAAAGPADAPINQDAQESGCSPADAPAAEDAPRMCASSEAEAAQALPSGDVGPAALADEGAADLANGLSLLLADCYEFTQYAAAPFFTKFPTQPKPSPEWWAGLRKRIERLQPLLAPIVERA